MEPDPTFRFGINANTQAWGGGTADEQGKVKAATDVRWLREDFLWSLMKTQACGLQLLPLRPRHRRSGLGWPAGPAHRPFHPVVGTPHPRDIPLDPASYALLMRQA